MARNVIYCKVAETAFNLHEWYQLAIILQKTTRSEQSNSSPVVTSPTFVKKSNYMFMKPRKSLRNISSKFLPCSSLAAVFGIL